MVTRKNVRILILLACGIALVLASSGCKKKEEPVGEPTVKTPTKKKPAVGTPTEKGPTVETPTKKGPTVETPTKKTYPDRPKRTFVVQPLVGIDKVRFGMTVEQMKEILGEPVRSRGIVHEYRDLGLAILAIKDNTVTMIACGDRRRADSPLVKNCTVRTKKGIGMGSSKEAVIKAYGQPSSTQELPVPGDDSAVMLRYDQLSSEFMLRNGKVTYMMFRAEGFAAMPGRPGMPPRPRSR